MQIETNYGYMRLGPGGFNTLIKDLKIAEIQIRKTGDIKRADILESDIKKIAIALIERQRKRQKLETQE